ncbi:MAG: AAA family ATPase [Anaerolineae bacterium]|nr:AAA family ATPase [Anaerolineae bacterium]
MAHLDISLLGQFEVALDGQAVTCFRTDKTRALLAYLAVESGRAHRRAFLAGQLWPDVPEVTARHNLSQSLLLLRRALGEEAVPFPFLLVTTQTLRFNPHSDYTLDVAEFEAGVTSVSKRACASHPPELFSLEDAQTLALALEWYRGEFLSTPLRVDSQAFEEWQLLKQTQYHILAVDTLDCLAQYHELHGGFAQVVDYARRQIALEPLREQAHRQLMRALALDGRGPEALAHYAACQALLAQELGIEPAPETTALYEKIRTMQQTSSLPPPTRPRERSVGGALTLLPTFVGRTQELARLDKALASALAGQGQVMFVTGDAGSGKTTLLSAFARRALTAHGDVLVVNGNGNVYTGLGEPYWPFIQMLRQLRAGAANGAVLHHLQDQRLAAARPDIQDVIARHSPDLNRIFSDEGLQEGEPGLVQAGLFAQIARGLQALAFSYSLVMLFDDLQWADRDSLNLLFHLGRQLAGQRILIVGAFRPDVLEQGYSSLVYLHEQDAGQRHPLAAVVNELQRLMGDIRIDLARVEGRAFVDALLDSEPNHLGAEFRETFYQHTGGHALFATELLRGMQERGDLLRDAQGYWVEGEQVVWQAFPARVEAVIAERIGQLLPEWQSMLAVASVEGGEFTVQVIARVLGLPEAEVGRWLSGALARYHHLVAPVGVQQIKEQSLSRYRFRHLLFQKYLYRQLDAVERAQLHQAVGGALETVYGARAADVSLSLARHFELGGEMAKAIAYLLQAGRRAAYLMATEEALRLLTHGLALLGRLELSSEREQLEVELQLALGNALLPRGWIVPERAQAFERAYELSRRAGTTTQLAHSLLQLADVNLARGQLDQVMAIGEQLLDLSQSTGDLQVAVLAHYTLGGGFFFLGRLLPARDHLRQADALSFSQVAAKIMLPEAGIDVRSRVWLTQVLWALGYADQAIACSQQAVARARDLDHTFSWGFALAIGELIVHQLRGEPKAMRGVLQQLVSLGSDAGLGLFRLWAMLFQGWLAAVEDHDPAGLPQIQRALDQWESAGAQGGRFYHYVLLAEAHLALGQVEAAHTILEHTLVQVRSSSLRFFEAELERLYGEALCALGRPAEAEGCFLRAIAVAREQEARAWELRSLLSLCRLRQAAGEPAAFEAARRQLAELLAWFTEGLDTPDLQAAALVAGTAALH